MIRLSVIAACLTLSASTPDSRIQVVDGDTVRQAGVTYRLVGFDAPERGAHARCRYERELAERASQRLQDLIDHGATLQAVACHCPRAGPCNYGRSCAVMLSPEHIPGARSIGVAEIMIAEGLARPYVCTYSGCPRRLPWCYS